MTTIPSTPAKNVWTMNRKESLAHFMSCAAAWLAAADSIDDGAEDRHDKAYCDMHTAASSYFYRYGCLRPEVRAGQIAKQHAIGGSA